MSRKKTVVESVPMNVQGMLLKSTSLSQQNFRGKEDQIPKGIQLINLYLRYIHTQGCN